MNLAWRRRNTRLKRELAAEAYLFVILVYGPKE